jgi:hypothetical protein
MIDPNRIREQVLGAVARGWRHPENSHKVVDVTLAEAITQEVVELITNDKHYD